MNKSRIFERLKDYFRKKREIDLTEREFPTNYEDFVVSWNDEFQRRVMEEFIERSKRERQLKEEEFVFQNRLNRKRLEEIQQRRKVYDNA
jgi:hypothetical protein